MARSAEAAALVILAVMLSGLSRGQPGTTFAYTGDDAVEDAMDTHNVHFGGFSNSVLVAADADEQLVWPWLPALFYEYNYLLRPCNNVVNVSLGAAPEINLFPLFMGRVTGLAEITLGAEAHNRPGHGAGLRFGAGFTAFGSSFGFTENSPVLRAGFLVNNIRITYMYSTAKPLYINHQLTVGIKFDW
jgi:hypothetical protein